MRKRLLPVLALFSATPGLAFDLQSTTVPGRAPPSLSEGEIAIKRADKRLIFKNSDGTLGFGSLLNAIEAGRKAVEAGDASDLRVGSDAFATDGTLARILGRTGGATPNLWYNPDGALGDGAPKVVYNDGLSIYGPRRWVFQQVTLTPYVTGQRVKAADGATAIRMLNGYAALGPVAIGTGPKTFTVAAGLNFVPGFPVKAVVANDLSRSMSGTIASYSGTTVVLNVTAVTGSGTFTDWTIGAPGTTKQGQTKLITTAASPAGSKTLTFADTTGVQIGANVEFAFDAAFNTINGIQRGTYVVARTGATVTLSQPTVSPAGATGGAAVVQGQQITFYGNQGNYLFQDVQVADAVGFRYGTPEARDAWLAFDVVSSGLPNCTASMMMLGYKSISELGRSYVQSFPVTSTKTRMTLRIKGDKVGAPGTWKAGYGANDWGGLWGTIGFAWESQGTPTAQNIPDGQWSDVFAVGGSDQQTCDLTGTVGASVDVSNVNLTLEKPTPYVPPTEQSYPSPQFRARATRIPQFVWEATNNPTNMRIWHSYLTSDGSLGLGRLDDNGNETSALLLSLDGTATLPAYPAGTLSVDATGKLVGVTVKAAKEPLVPVNGRLVWFGDSLSAKGDAKYDNAVSNAGYGLTTWAKAINGSRLYVPPGGNFGISGDTLQNMVTRLQPVLDARPAIVSVLAGTNSIGTTSDGQMIRLLRTIYSTFLANGIKVIAIPILPRYDAGWTAENERQRLAVNAWIRTQAGPRLTVLDLEGRIPSSLLADGVHPNNQTNAFAIGQVVGNALADLTAGDAVNMLDGVQSSYTPNLRFTGTGGTMNGSPTPTGQVADGWLLSTAGGATVTASKITDAFGNPGQRIVVSGTYSGSNLDIPLAVNGDLSSGLPAAEDVIEGMVDFTISGSPVGIGAVQLQGTVYTSGYAAILGSVSTWLPITRTDPVPPGLSGRRVVMRSPALKLSPGVPAVLPQRIAISLLNAGTPSSISLTLDVWGAAVRNVPSGF